MTSARRVTAEFLIFLPNKEDESAVDRVAEAFADYLYDVDELFVEAASEPDHLIGGEDGDQSLVEAIGAQFRVDRLSIKVEKEIRKVKQ